MRLTCDHSRAAESRDASTQLNEIFARVSSCGKEDMTQCTACPDIIVPASSTKRDVVPMNGIGHGEWKAGETIETHGLSVCTVIAVWDEEHWIMAHIPPAREGNNGELAATNEELINEYLAKADDRWNNYTWDRPLGLSLVSIFIDPDLREKLSQWFKAKGILTNEQTYSPNDLIQGSGNLVLSREGADYPPNISFI